MWDLPEPGIEPMSPSLAGGFFTTEPISGNPPHTHTHISFFEGGDVQLAAPEQEQLQLCVGKINRVDSRGVCS